MYGAGFLRDLLHASRGNPSCCPPYWQQGSRSLGEQWGGGEGTSDQQVLAKGDRTGGFPQMGLRALVLASHRRCWVQPGIKLWGLMDTTGCSDHRASSWHGAWPISLSREQFTQDRRLVSGCQTPTLGHSCHHSLPHVQPRPMHPPLQLHDPWPRALLAPVGSGHSCPSDPGEEGPGWPD